MYKLEISEKALSMLQNHIRFLAQVSPSVAKNTKSNIVSGLKSLESNPERYPYIEADFIPKKKYRKMLIVKKYIAIYQIIKKTIFVELILDCRQNQNLVDLL